VNIELIVEPSADVDLLCLTEAQPGRAGIAWSEVPSGVQSHSRVDKTRT